MSISTGSNTRVAVEPNLNWALATPGSLGSLGIVDLNQQSSNAITAISRTNNGTTNVVTVTVQSTASSPPLSVLVGDAVQIQNVAFPAGTDPTIAAQAPSFNGFYAVSSVGPASNQFSYTQTGAALPNVATQSIPQAAAGTVNYAQPVATVGVADFGPGDCNQSGNATSGVGRSHDERGRFLFQFDRSIRLLAVAENKQCRGRGHHRRRRTIR